ncbi:hypothetical protein JW992_01455 [candidate division KSB1 bacterium]|nr:hypothetical protein [candidate division KSB1 bacterium]
MGQQQLLLLVLGAIIVGLAIVVGINLFGQGAVKANEDAVRQDILSMMARAEEWYRKPVMMGGAGKATDLSSISWANLGYRASDGSVISGAYTNDNGSYALTGGTSTVTIVGTCAENTAVKVTGTLTINSAQVSSISVTSSTSTGT